MLRGSYSQVAPAMDGAFQDDSVVYTGGLDGLVRRRASCRWHTPHVCCTCWPARVFSSASLARRYDFFTRTELVLGAHERSVRCVEWLSERGALATGGWDASLRVWGPAPGHGVPRAPAPWL